MNGRVELARVVRATKGGNKIQGRRYATIAAALWHASQNGGGMCVCVCVCVCLCVCVYEYTYIYIHIGVVTAEAGEYHESETLQPTARNSQKSSV